MMDPSVSVPIVTAAMFAAAAIAEPLLDEHGVADGTYGFYITNPIKTQCIQSELQFAIALLPSATRNQLAVPASKQEGEANKKYR